MSVGADQPRSPLRQEARVTVLPKSLRGRWAVGLAAAFFPLLLAATLMPRAAALGFVCGLAGGAVAVLAIIRDRERALTVFAAVLPLLVAVAFVLVEVITGNP